MLARRLDRVLEDRLGDRMPPVGREFGSPDFERLMEEDYRAKVGVFDPAIKHAFVKSAFAARDDDAWARFQLTGAGRPATDVIADMRTRLEARRTELQSKHPPADA